MEKMTLAELKNATQEMRISNDSMDKEYENPVLKSKKRLRNQKGVHKKEKKQRDPDEYVDINGKQIKWGQFKRKFYGEIKKKIDSGRQVDTVEFIMNKDKENEKLMRWSYKNGFVSENSEDENVKYQSTLR